nr:retrotransposon protein, putative, Ty1-copia subclass [Tanacetum cinerariifolium]
GLPKKETPQVMMIKGGKIQKSNKKSLKAKGKGKANGKGKDKQVYIRVLRSKETETRSSLFVRGNGVRAQVEAIGSFDLVLPNGLVICLDNCHYAPSITRGVVSVHLLQLTPPYTPQHNGVSERRKRTLLDMVQSTMNLTISSLSLWVYALAFATRILNMVPTKMVDKTPYELRYDKFFEKNLITQEVSGRAVDSEEIQDEDTSHSEITSKIPIEVEGFEPPQEEVISIRRSERTHRAPNHLCLNVEVKEHSLGDLNEPASYKAGMIDS